MYFLIFQTNIDQWSVLLKAPFCVAILGLQFKVTIGNNILSAHHHLSQGHPVIIHMGIAQVIVELD